MPCEVEENPAMTTGKAHLLRRQAGRQAGRQRFLADLLPLPVLLFLLISVSAGCGASGSKKGSGGNQSNSTDDTVQMTLAIPLTPEQATALAGISRTDEISRTDDLVLDIYANDELVAEDVSGGLRAGVRGGVRAGVRTAPRRGRLADPPSSAHDPRRTRPVPRAAPHDSESISFEATFAFPKKVAREGDNALVSRLRPRAEKKASLVQVRTKVTITGAGDPAQIEIVGKDISLGEVELPDADGDGVSTLLEAISLGVQAALDAQAKPTEEQVKAAIEQFASKLVEEMKKQGLVVAVDINKIDFTPPQSGLGFAAGEVTLSKLPSCEAGKAIPEPDTVETRETSASFVLCANEAASFQCSVDGAASASCQSPLLLTNLEAGRHSLVVIASDSNGNTQKTFLSFRWKVVIAQEPLPGESTKPGDTTTPTVNLAAPAGLTASAGNGGVTLSWNAVSGATGYKVYYGASSTTLSQSVISTETKTTIGNLTNGTTYYFAVSSTASALESARSETASATPTGTSQEVVLSAPTGLAATVGDKQIALAWNAVSGASSYKVYYGTAQDQLTTTATATTTNATVTGLTNGTTYYFGVTTVSGSTESAKSAVVSAKPTAVADTTAPTFAGLSTATATSTSQIDLSWTAATDNVSASTAIVYKICQSTTAGACGAAFTATYTTSAGATSSNVTGLTASTAYYFLGRAVDAAGNQDSNTVEKSATTQASATPSIYIPDRNNNRVRKVAQGGVISTIVGSGSASFSGDGGAATLAGVSQPADVAFDSAGNFFIVEYNGHRIRKIDTQGVITSFAGNGTAAFAGDGGPATSASLNWPISLAVDSSGNLYVADSSNNRIRKVDIGGTITTVVGNGTAGFGGDGGAATSASINDPRGIAIDAAGNLYIAEMGNDRIRKVSTQGVITTVAGNGTATFAGDGGAAISASLNDPSDVAIDSFGNLYIAEYQNMRIRKVNTSGIITTIAGNGTYGFGGDGGPATSAVFYAPAGIAVDSQGNVYVTDHYNHRIRKIDTLGIITTFAGNGTAAFAGDGGAATSASLNWPWGLWVQ